jgi:hypothetical protein
MSAIPAIETHLLTLLDGATDAKVVLGYDTAPELVAVFTCEFERDYRLLGGSPAPLEESFKIDLIVEVLKTSGRDMMPANTRAWEIFEELDAAIRGDHHLDGISWDARLTKGTREFFQTDSSQGCRIRSTLTGTARI